MTDLHDSSQAPAPLHVLWHGNVRDSDEAVHRCRVVLHSRTGSIYVERSDQRELETYSTIEHGSGVDVRLLALEAALRSLAGHAVTSPA